PPSGATGSPRSARSYAPAAARAEHVADAGLVARARLAARQHDPDECAAREARAEPPIRERGRPRRGAAFVQAERLHADPASARRAVPLEHGCRAPELLERERRREEP